MAVDAAGTSGAGGGAVGHWLGGSSGGTRRRHVQTMIKHHVIISGTGRAGTAFLVQLLPELGLETGFPDPFSNVFPNCDAGMEWDIRQPDAPYIVKNPRLCDSLDALVQDGGVVIDRAIIPVRNLH